MTDTAQNSTDGRLLVRATINLPGLPLGRRAWVDPTIPYIADALAAEHVVPVQEEEVDARSQEPSKEGS